MGFMEDIRGAIEGCPGSFDSSIDVCKACSMASECKTDRMEDMVDPERYAEFMVKAAEATKRIMEKKRTEATGGDVPTLPHKTIVFAPTMFVDLTSQDLMDDFASMCLRFYKSLISRAMEDDVVSVKLIAEDACNLFACYLSDGAEAVHKIKIVNEHKKHIEKALKDADDARRERDSGIRPNGP